MGFFGGKLRGHLDKKNQQQQSQVRLNFKVFTDKDNRERAKK